MTKNRKLFIGIAGVLLVAAVIFIGTLIYDELKPPSTDTAVFQSSIFSFAYPRTYALKESSTGAANIGSQPEEGEFMPMVQVVRYTNDPDSPRPPSYDVYLQRQVVALCGSDSAETIVCKAGTWEPYTSPTGLEGQRSTLTMTRTNLTSGTTTESTYGPITAFDVTQEPTIEDPLRYQAVFVYPALESVITGTTSTELLDEILGTLTLGRPIVTTTPAL